MVSLYPLVLTGQFHNGADRSEADKAIQSTRDAGERTLPLTLQTWYG